jgi:hypothetical protein
MSVAFVQFRVAALRASLSSDPSDAHGAHGAHHFEIQHLLHTLSGLHQTWTTYLHSLTVSLHQFRSVDQQVVFEPGSSVRHGFQEVVQETRSQIQYAQRMLVWLSSLHQEVREMSMAG